MRFWGCGGVIRPVRVSGRDKTSGVVGVIRPVGVSGRDMTSEVLGVWWSDKASEGEWEG